MMHWTDLEEGDVVSYIDDALQRQVGMVLDVTNCWKRLSCGCCDESYTVVSLLRNDGTEEDVILEDADFAVADRPS